MAPNTAAEEHRKGVWSGEIPTPIDWFNGPMTKPEHLPWVPSPMTRLYHDNANYMFAVEKPEIVSSSIPRANEPYKGKLGKGWNFLEEDTPDYGGVAWKVGSDPSCLVVPGLLHESESYWMASEFSLKILLDDADSYSRNASLQLVKILDVRQGPTSRVSRTGSLRFHTSEIRVLPHPQRPISPNATRICQHPDTQRHTQSKTRE